jgi:hypothetical protein
MSDYFEMHVTRIGSILLLNFEIQTHRLYSGWIPQHPVSITKLTMKMLLDVTSKTSRQQVHNSDKQNAAESY